MLAKKNRKRILLAISVLLLCFLAVGLAGCDSKEQPLPEEYQGYFRYGSSGCVRLAGENCSACNLYVNNLEINGEPYTGSIKIEAQGFHYFSDGSFEFTGTVKSFTDNTLVGNAVLTGKISSLAIRQLNIDQASGSLVFTTTPCSDPIHNHS